MLVAERPWGFDSLRPHLHGLRVNFGVFLNPAAEGYPDLLRQVDAAERGGLDLVGIQDHPYQPRFLDAFALIADLLARTERLRSFRLSRTCRSGHRRCWRRWARRSTC